jgi:hypothetical protein
MRDSAPPQFYLAGIWSNSTFSNVNVNTLWKRTTFARQMRISPDAIAE